MIVELTVAMREFGITFRGVWGFSTLQIQQIDQAVFTKIHALRNLPRHYVLFHMGKLKDENSEKRRLAALEAMKALEKVIGRDKFELYAFMKAWSRWLDERDLKSKLPDLEICQLVKVDLIAEP